MKGDKIYYKKGYKYQLQAAYKLFVGIFPSRHVITDWVELYADGYINIRKGYAWDGASGPTFDTKSSMRGSLVHDALYQLMRMGLIDESNRPIADQLLHDTCVEDGMIPIRADLWKFAVEDFASFAAQYGTEQEILTAP